MHGVLIYKVKHINNQKQGVRAVFGEALPLDSRRTTVSVGQYDVRGNDNGIKFHLDPAMLEQLRNAPGFVPVIINVQPMTDLRKFLGIVSLRSQ
jgi:hypothetical protein